MKENFWERNGLGKYYYESGELMFEGEYLNGKVYGQVKQYYKNGELLFEGVYLNGKGNGKGKCYYKSGKLMFEGEYFNGEKNGKGKEYNDNGAILFEGKYLNGKANGRGKYKENKIIQMVNCYLKVNKQMKRYGMEKDIALLVNSIWNKRWKRSSKRI